MVTSALVDLETTGLQEPIACDLSFQPYIIEICIMVVNNKGKEIDFFNSLVKPPVQVPEYITSITGISDIDLNKAPSFSDIYKKINKVFSKADVFVAHNCCFDYNILNYEFLRISKKHFKNSNLPKKLFCTVEQSKHLKGFRLKLNELYFLLTKKDMKGHHRAKNDVLALYECYRRLKKCQ